jgi:hypothetical protein
LLDGSIVKFSLVALVSGIGLDFLELLEEEVLIGFSTTFNSKYTK